MLAGAAATKLGNRGYCEGRLIVEEAHLLKFSKWGVQLFIKTPSIFSRVPFVSRGGYSVWALPSGPNPSPLPLPSAMDKRTCLLRALSKLVAVPATTYRVWE